jgi:NADH-quinone oxidoreductase subunit C
VSTLERVQSALSATASRLATGRDTTACLEIAPADVHEACRRLRDAAGFETNTFVTAIDRFPATPRFEIHYQFLSIAHNDRVRLFARADEPAHVPTITDLFPGTSFSERECYDMFGITFDGSADSRRLLMPDDYGHFPLRKDFPHHGIEPDRLYREWDAKRHARAAAQDAAASARSNEVAP